MASHVRPAVTALSVTILLSASSAMARDDTAPSAYPMACRYIRTELDRHAQCARRDGAMVRIAPAHAARLHFHRGLAEVAIDGIGWLWVRRDGLGLPVFPFDNGPDPFEQGLARGWRDGKVAFYDRRLSLALATPYDWAYPFNIRGEALVCEGCRSDGNVPASMVGGRWGVIDRQGRVLEPLSENGTARERYLVR